MSLWPEEIILVDAGSKDRTFEIVSKWADENKLDIKCRIISSPGALPGRGRNLGIEKASTEWIAFLDAGVLPDRNWLENLYRFVAKNASRSAWGNCIFSGDKGLEKMLCASGYGQNTKRPYFLASSMFHREVFSRVGFFHEDLRGGEDTLWRNLFFDYYGRELVADNAIVYYRFFPRNFQSALRKWFIYAYHSVFSRTIFLQNMVYLLFFFLLLFVSAHSWLIFFLMVLIHFFLRGVFSPILKSHHWKWFDSDYSLILIAPFLILCLDFAKFCGILTGTLSDFFGYRLKTNGPRRMRVIRVVSIPLAFVHFQKVLYEQKRQEVDFLLVSQEGDYAKTLYNYLHLPHRFVNIAREINLFADIMALGKLISLFRKYRPDIVHSSTPKAGLLCSIAGFLARVPVRLHTFTGQRWVTETGLLRKILRNCDRLIVTLNTFVFTDSPSQTQFLIDEQIASCSKISTIHNGSFGGIDLDRFDFKKFPNQKEVLCRDLGIDKSSKIITFVGRITKDKGIHELVEAIRRMRMEHIQVDLVLLGFYEPELDPVDINIIDFIDEAKYIHFVGFSDKPEYYLSGSDLFCLPSYREGFGTVVLEAMAMKLPAVGTNIPGLRDAISDGETGLLVHSRDVDALRMALERLVLNDSYRRELGEKAYQRVRDHFSYKDIAKALYLQYWHYFSGMRVLYSEDRICNSGEIWRDGNGKEESLEL